MSTGGDMPKSIAAGLVKAQRATKDVEKDSTNTFHKYKYAAADAIAAEARRVLNLAGLALCRVGWTFSEFTDKSPARLNVRYMLVHEDGSTWDLPEVSVPSIPDKGRPEDKADAAALTYSAGYVALGLLQIERVDEHGVDARNDGATHREKKKPVDAGKVDPKRGMMTAEWLFTDCQTPAELGALVHLKMPLVKDGQRPAFKSALRSRALDLGCPEKVDGWLGLPPGGGHPEPT